MAVEGNRVTNGNKRGMRFRLSSLLHDSAPHLPVLIVSFIDRPSPVDTPPLPAGTQTLKRQWAPSTSDTCFHDARVLQLYRRFLSIVCLFSRTYPLACLPKALLQVLSALPIPRLSVPHRHDPPLPSSSALSSIRPLNHPLQPTYLIPISSLPAPPERPLRPSPFLSTCHSTTSSLRLIGFSGQMLTAALRDVLISRRIVFFYLLRSKFHTYD
ncbi:unnamed protein product [Cyclocybe aegerita]|uniref:Uncharacterized protein n=1 Tax=Cyclocybe aegerita TaxID=1973307 RepID=A0A8S0W3L2_CYCAE|nr:unnamed protein product [Cyclocybe aegerita]